MDELDLTAFDVEYGLSIVSLVKMQLRHERIAEEWFKKQSAYRGTQIGFKQKEPEPPEVIPRRKMITKEWKYETRPKR